MKKISNEYKLYFCISVFLLIISSILCFYKPTMAQYRSKIKVARANLNIIRSVDSSDTGWGNLYGTSTLYNDYLINTGQWGNTSSYDVVSMIVSVNPGDRLIANSFGLTSFNNTTGIRASYLLDGVFVSTLSPANTFNEYSKTGFLTVPDGVNQMNVVWWSEDDSNWLYLLYPNLYPDLELYNKYYDTNGNFTTNNNVVSAIIDVTPGDKIKANSFLAKGYNGTSSTTDGVRITYLLDDTIVSTRSPGQVYNECYTNGFLTVPDGVNKMNVVWWEDLDTNWLYKF